jgi:LysM repeat protein
LAWEFRWLPFDFGEPEGGTLADSSAPEADGLEVSRVSAEEPAEDVEMDPLVFASQTEPSFAERGPARTIPTDFDPPAPVDEQPPFEPAAAVVQISNEQPAAEQFPEPDASAPLDSSSLPAVSSPLKEFAEIDRLLAAGDELAAHRELSKVYWNRPELRGEIKSRIENTARSIYLSPQPHFLEPYVIEPGDQLRTVAAKYNVTWNYLAKLNRTDPRRIRAGQKLKVNKGPFAAVVDLSDFELTVHAHGYFICRYPVGIGKDNSSPIGTFVVLNKVANPQYTDPEGRVIASDDPNNPLGERWIDLGDSYGIHGTIDPNSIGRAESRGCIRLRNEDVEEVYDLLTVGSQVVIQR